MKKVDKEYLDFLEQKKQQRIESGFSIKEKDLNPLLFPFQKYCVKRALEVGKFAMFEDCGLGKTIQQLEWAKHVCNHIKQPVLILAPLAVISQTIKEGEKFGYQVTEIADTDNIEIKTASGTIKGSSLQKSKPVEIGITESNMLSEAELSLAMECFLKELKY